MTQKQNFHRPKTRRLPAPRTPPGLRPLPPRLSVLPPESNPYVNKIVHLIEQMAVFSPDHADELFRVYRAWNHAHTADLLLAYEGVEEVLIGLRAAGRRLGIVTSKSHDAVDEALGLALVVEGGNRRVVEVHWPAGQQGAVVVPGVDAAVEASEHDLKVAVAVEVDQHGR